MECLYQILIFLQRLLAPSKNLAGVDESTKHRLQSTESDVESYIEGDHELKHRWNPIKEVLRQERAWIEWKNDGAADWTLRCLEDHPWKDVYSRPSDTITLEDIHACLNDVGEAMEVEGRETDKMVEEMKAAEGLQGQFCRDLELPDFEELRVPTAKVEFWMNVLKNAFAGVSVAGFGRSTGIGSFDGDLGIGYSFLLENVSSAFRE